MTVHLQTRGIADAVRDRVVAVHPLGGGALGLLLAHVGDLSWLASRANPKDDLPALIVAPPTLAIIRHDFSEGFRTEYDLTVRYVRAYDASASGPDLEFWELVDTLAEVFMSNTQLGGLGGFPSTAQLEHAVPAEVNHNDEEAAASLRGEGRLGEVLVGSVLVRVTVHSNN